MKHTLTLTAGLLTVLAAAPASAQEVARWIAAAGGAAAPGSYADGAALTVCRARVNGEVLPGQLVARACSVGVNGRAVRVAAFETLAVPAQSVHWARHASEAHFDDAVDAGHRRGGEASICRAGVGPASALGWAWASVCHVAVGGREEQRTDYEVLVANARSVGWVAVSDGSLPLGAAVAGRAQGEPQYLCRGQHAGEAHGGRVAGGQCSIGHGGVEVRVASYEVLVSAGRGVAWVGSAAQGALPNEVRGGSDNHQPEGVCRAMYRSSLLPGRLVGSRCHVAYRGREVLASSYEVLITTTPPPR